MTSDPAISLLGIYPKEINGKATKISAQDIHHSVACNSSSSINNQINRKKKWWPSKYPSEKD